MDTWEAIASYAEDSKDLIGFVLALLGGIVALWRYSSDKAWERNKFAHDYADVIYADPVCRFALDLIDWHNEPVGEPLPDGLGAPPGTMVTWEPRTAARAMRVHGPYDKRDVYIRDAFDGLLNRLDRLGHAVKSGLLGQSEFPSSLAYYFGRLEQRRSLGIAFVRYLRAYGFLHVAKLSPKLRRLVHLERKLAERAEARITAAAAKARGLDAGAGA